MSPKRAHTLFIIFSGTFSLNINEPITVNQSYSRNDTLTTEALDEWFIYGFECCNNIVQTNYTESPGLLELNKVPDILYSGTIEEIQDIMKSINDNTELVIANSVNPYITVAYTCTALFLFVIGFLIQKFKRQTLRLSLRDNSPTYQDNEYSGNNIVSSYV